MGIIKDTDVAIQEVEDFIVESVQAGTKAVELVVEVVSKIKEAENSDRFDSIDIVSTLGRLISEGRLVEVEYILPSIPNRIKSFILPAEAKVLSVTVDGKKKEIV